MDKPSRPVRNRKRSRKAWPPGDTHRPVKRLFTPEIKRMLKDWLVRRRENPYPNREEKKLLAHETGLTYTQICNWFANWRRKLKNSGNDPPTRKTWGNLIKNYNTNARGNVEQFSICSSDSIWGEHGVTQIDGKYVPESGTTLEPLILTTAATYTHPYGKEVQTNGTLYLTPTTTLSPAVTPLVSTVPNASRSSRSSKYKNSIMEKYLRDLGELETAKQERPTVVPVLMAAIPLQQAHYHHHHTAEYDQQKHPPPPPPPQEHPHLHDHHQPSFQVGCEGSILRGPPSLSKWLESTAKFTPSKHNYIDWDISGKQSATKKRCDSGGTYYGITGGPPEDSPPTSSYSETADGPVPLSHQKDEIDAAEALTRLANNFRTKFST
ncbi:hypothetical protein ZHAS_00008631 [Anopheles sinensis]|uniref:Homeobox domain-containing protein n=1 Tax=Anopheles sinensis TaxID=74873 RepID=A0A084VSS1_ANOSI|nr:hypothetical protein ZHAS_00008631 [Anopheles sinensis]